MAKINKRWLPLYRSSRPPTWKWLNSKNQNRQTTRLAAIWRRNDDSKSSSIWTGGTITDSLGQREMLVQLTVPSAHEKAEERGAIVTPAVRGGAEGGWLRATRDTLSRTFEMWFLKGQNLQAPHPHGFCLVFPHSSPKLASARRLPRKTTKWRGDDRI